mmetsp:Transcript_109414/g.274060  ORF Transcript_109414/g.274060 Transcript_109414/m.274060 type:complete len:402 (+) Transcript_109414:81-1286(+)
MVKPSEAALGVGMVAGCLLAAPGALNFATSKQSVVQSRFVAQQQQLGALDGQRRLQRQKKQQRQQQQPALRVATGAVVGMAAVRAACVVRRRATRAKASAGLERSLIRLHASQVAPPPVSEAPDGCVRLRHRSGATCDVSIYAAHVVSWCLPDAGEQLFTSSDAILGTPGTAIRGGVPICWPQFGTFETAKDAPKLKHGFVRQSGNWQVSDVSEDTVILRLTPDAEMLKKWPSEFEFFYKVILGAKSLSLKMEVTNTGAQPLEFTGCLHTYFRCEACTDCTVEGLKGEKVDVGIGDFFRGAEIEKREHVTFDGESEIQLLYGGTADAIVLHDGADRRLRLTKMNMPDWVLWNIGDDNAHTLKDLGSGEQRKYVCVEPGFATVPQRVAPGATWCGMHEIQAL